MISLMTPSRGRPESLKRMAESARDTAAGRLEIIVWLDADDPLLTENLHVCRQEKILYQLGPRSIIHSSRWDRCLRLATGELLFHVNDDVILKTPCWDEIVEDFFAGSTDKLWLAGGDDAYLHSETLIPHPIVHRRWVESLGYFIPPYFDGEYGDTWASDLATRIVRMKFLPFVCEHMHYTRNSNEPCPQCGERTSIASVAEGDFCNRCGALFNQGKSRMDQTARDYLARSQKQDPARIYAEREPERIADAAKLKVLLGIPWRSSSKS